MFRIFETRSTSIGTQGRRERRPDPLTTPLRGAVLLGLTLAAVALPSLAAEPAPAAVARPPAGHQFPATRHVREVVQNGSAARTGRLALDHILRLDLVLALRDPAGLDAFLDEVNNPTGPQYRHFLSVAEFTQRFGPSEADYDAVVRFAAAQGLKVVGGSRDGMDVQVEAPVSAINQAFTVNLLTYRHPTEGREFYAPDREPSTPLPFALWHISGLDNFSTPKALHGSKPVADAANAGASSDAQVGSGPGKLYLGSDMRAAYYGNGPLTGAGQNLGLFEFFGTDLSDLDTYFANTGQKNHVPVSVISTDGTSTQCVDTKAGGNCDDSEQTLDMTQAIGMAPGLASLTMYVGGSDTAIISAMTTHNPLPTTIGCSWGWTPVDPTVLDPYFKRMAAQGQNFFAASGDSSTWSATNNAWPADDPNVVSVGGTAMTTSGAGGKWASEAAWSGSGGGISPNQFPIPAYQHLAGVINPRDHGSIVYRNGPDVAANANTSFYVCANQVGCPYAWYGTSFAAPMWAGYIALVNQQLTQSGQPRLGFLNPTIYSQDLTVAYDGNFHDVTSGTSGSYAATTGYDLVTGWGSPNAGLLNALAPGATLETIWRFTGAVCGGTCPGWTMLDDNNATVRIAASGGNLYQLHQTSTTGTPTGQIWKSTGAACSGTSCPGWTLLDDNPAVAAIAADGNSLYQLHDTGRIWKYTGVACSGTSCPGWQMYDDNPAAVAIAASGGALYQLHDDGSIWKSTGAPCNGNACYGWELLDNNPAATAIVADGAALYQLHNDGTVWRSTGAPCNGAACYGWVELDNSPLAVSVAAAAGNLYELRSNGQILKAVSPGCATTCTGWELLDDNAGATAIVADGASLYELHSSGAIWRWTGQACSGTSCAGWTKLDDNILTTQIVAGGGELFQFHGRR